MNKIFQNSIHAENIFKCIRHIHLGFLKVGKQQIVNIQTNKYKNLRQL